MTPDMLPYHRAAAAYLLAVEREDLKLASEIMEDQENKALFFGAVAGFALGCAQHIAALLGVTLEEFLRVETLRRAAL